MPQRVLGLDIGSWSIKAVLVETKQRQAEVIDAIEARIEPGVDLDLQVEQLVESLQFKADVVSVNFAAEQVTHREVSLPFKDEKQIEQTLYGELADQLPIDVDDCVYGFFVMEKTENGSLSHVAVVKKEHIAEFLRNDIKELEPKYLLAESLSVCTLYDHYLHADASRAEVPAQDAQLEHDAQSPPARLLLNIGHEKTVVSVCSARGIEHTRCLPWGGNQLTSAIKRTYDVEQEQAIQIKHDSAVFVSRKHPAPNDATQAMSDTLAASMQPLLKEIRRTLKSVAANHRVYIERVDVLGGSALLRHLTGFLADQLGLAVSVGQAACQPLQGFVPTERQPAFAPALAAALMPVARPGLSSLNFRVGPFAFTGGLEQLKVRMPFLAASAALIIVLLCSIAISQFLVLARQDSALTGSFEKITKEAVGRAIKEPSVAIAALKEPVTELGSFKLPEQTAVDVAVAISSLFPEKTGAVIEELEITQNKARVAKAKAPGFEAVDKIVVALKKEKCFKEIRKPKATRTNAGKDVDFEVVIDLECSQ